ncbi:MAG: tail fiber domain-containing protein [Bacteroidales bacterium]
MKRTFIITVLAALFSSVLAQAPRAFNYQATARGASGELITEQALDVRVGILKNDILIWQEDHSVVTNQYGHFSLSIGGDDAVNGEGTAGAFENIDWGSGTFDLKLGINDGTGFTDLGTNEMLSVPYALYAASGPHGDNQTLSLSGTDLSISRGNTVDLSVLAAGIYSPWTVNDYGVSLEDPKLNLGIGTSQPMAKLAIQGDIEIPDDFPLFEIKNHKSELVLAGYNNGVFINIENDPLAKGLKGGFAVGGYNSTKAEHDQEFFRVTNDSIRVFVNDDIQRKGLKGGFAVGGYSSGKATVEPHFFVAQGGAKVNGNLELTGEIVQLSDQRLKENIVSIDEALMLIQQLNGVYYDWNQEARDKFAVEETKQLGVLAQDVEILLPQLVKTNEKGFKMVEYSKLTPVLLEAIKEQQRQIEVLQEENSRINDLEERILQLEKLVK